MIPNLQNANSVINQTNNSIILRLRRRDSPYMRTSLFRYKSCYDTIPEISSATSARSSKSNPVPMSTRVSRVMRRLVVSESEDKMR